MGTPARLNVMAIKNGLKGSAQGIEKSKNAHSLNFQ